MPNLNGTGPRGQGAMTGRRRGRCRATQPAQIEKSEIQTAENKDIIHGVGRGGKPHGGGQGNCYGGKGKGRRFYNQLTMVRKPSSREISTTFVTMRPQNV
jgi:hypothetical protein